MERCKEAAVQVSLPFAVVRAADACPGIEQKGSIDDVVDHAAFIQKVEELAKAQLVKPSKVPYGERSTA